MASYYDDENLPATYDVTLDYDNGDNQVTKFINLNVSWKNEKKNINRNPFSSGSHLFPTFFRFGEILAAFPASESQRSPNPTSTVLDKDVVVITFIET